MKLSLFVTFFLTIYIHLFSKVDSKIVCNTTTVEIEADILFLIDYSRSMEPYIRAVTNGLSTFASAANERKVTTRFGIGIFSDLSRLILPFTSNVNLTRNTLSKIKTYGGWEASLEAIRMSLTNNGSDFRRDCLNYSNISNYECYLNWNPNAKKMIILVTDEDSDIPTLSKYRVSGQNLTENSSLCQYNYTTTTRCDFNKIEPNFSPKIYLPSLKQYVRSGPEINLEEPWLRELNITADLLMNNNIMLSALIRSDENPTTSNRIGPISYFDNRNLYWRDTNQTISNSYHSGIAQFGDPSLAVEDINFTNFDSQITLERLIKNNLGNSLQGQILSRGGYMRLFQLQEMSDLLNSNSSSVTDSFFNAMADVIQQCYFIEDEPVIESTTSSEIIVTSWIESSLSIETSSITLSTEEILSSTTLEIIETSESLLESTTTSEEITSTTESLTIETSTQESTSTTIEESSSIIQTSESESTLNTDEIPQTTSSIEIITTSSSEIIIPTTDTIESTIELIESSSTLIQTPTPIEETKEEEKEGDNNQVGIIIGSAVGSALVVMGASAAFFIGKSQIIKSFSTILGSNSTLSATTTASNPMFEDPSHSRENPLYKPYGSSSILNSGERIFSADDLV